jgi:uncharacterized protein
MKSKTAGNTAHYVVERTAAYVRSKLQGDSSGHDWWHTYRVWKGAVYIGRREQADLLTVQLAALLHDIADWKLHKGDTNIGARSAKKWLTKCEVDGAVVTHVGRIISTISFKGAGVRSSVDSLEGKVVQDADRLDALGAIGIGRTFAYGGHTGRIMYDPKRKPQLHRTAEQYLSSGSPSINHFYEKLLLLKDRMNTPTAKQIAQGRHNFMVAYLNRFKREWDWKDVEASNAQTDANL